MHEWGLQGGGEATRLKGEGEKESEKEGVAGAKTLRRVEQPLGRPVAQGYREGGRGWPEMELEG